MKPYLYSNDLASVGATIYQRVNNNLQLAFGSVYARKCQNIFASNMCDEFSGDTLTSFDLAAKYNLDDQTVLRSKINKASQFVLAISHGIKPG